MDLQAIKNRIAKLSAVVEGWTATEDIPSLERDLALDELRLLYEAIRFAAPPRVEPASIEEAAAAAATRTETREAMETTVPPEPEEPSTDMLEEPEPEPEFAIDLGEVLAMGIDSEEEPDSTPEPVAEPEPEPVKEPARATVTTQTLFGMDDEAMVRHRRKQRVIMSLYGNEPHHAVAKREEEHDDDPVFEEIDTAPVAVPEPDIRPEQEPAAEPETEAREVEQEVDDDEDVFMEIAVDPQPDRTSADEHESGKTVLGDVINHDVKTIADTITPRTDMATELHRQERVDDLRKAVDINDKFLIIRDLFDGNGAAYEVTMRALNACGSLDDCMIYIAEHYAWNPNSDGAKTMMDLLERKFA